MEPAHAIPGDLQPALPVQLDLSAHESANSGTHPTNIVKSDDRYESAASYESTIAPRAKDVALFHH
jgi:hypothetical protein